jgi:hypothetical protein
VLHAAEFRALDAIHARRVCPQPELVVMPRDEILLATEVRRPEAVDHVVGVEPDQRGAADRKVNLVRESHAVLRYRILILHLPPPLVSGDADGQAG